MSSSVEVASATFTLRPKRSQQVKDDGKRVHKVSLVNDAIDSSMSNNVRSDRDVSLDAPDDHTRRDDYFTVTEGSRFLATDRSDFGLAGNSYLYSSDSRYEPFYFSSERDRETPPTGVSMDTDGSRGSDWWNVRSEVQVNSEPVPGRRSWVEPHETPAERDMGVTGTAWSSNSGADQADGFFPGVFTATRVDLSLSPVPSPPDADPEPSVASSPHEMDALKDTLRSIAPPVRHRNHPRGFNFSSLPPIVEDAPNSVPAFVSSPSPPTPPPSLPPDFGLNWSAKDLRTPFSMILEQKSHQETPARGLILPSRASAISSMVMRKNSLPNLTVEDAPHQVNGFLGTSRLENSLLFSGYSSGLLEENNQTSGHRGIYRAASLPEVNFSHDYLSSFSKSSDLFTSTLPSYQLSSSANSLPGTMEPSRISRSSLVIHSPPPSSPTSNLVPSLNLELYRTLSPDSSPKPPSLQRRLSTGTSSMESIVPNGFGGDMGVALGPDRNLLAKYRAFPDAYVSSSVFTSNSL